MHLLAGAKENDVILQKNTSFILSLFYAFLIRQLVVTLLSNSHARIKQPREKKKEKEKLNR